MNLGTGCQFVGGGGTIKSIQSGSISLNSANTNTATITSVDVNNTTLRHAGLQSNYAGGNFSNVSLSYIKLTNATTVSASRGNNGADTCSLSFWVIERNPGMYKSSVQRGNISCGSGVASNTATVTSVDTTKAVLSSTGWETSADTTAKSGDFVLKLTLTNATTVTATRGTSPTFTTDIQFELEEENF